MSAEPLQMIMSALQTVENADAKVMKGHLEIVKSISAADLSEMDTHQQAILFATVTKFITMPPSTSEEQLRLVKQMETAFEAFKNRFAT